MGGSGYDSGPGGVHGGGHDDDGFAGRLAGSPAVGQLLRAALREEDGTAAPYLRARRLIEHELHAMPDEIGEWDFRHAAGRRQATGHQAESGILARIADTSGLLAAVSREWHGLYLGRPPTVAEENDARLLNTGQVTLLDRTQTPGCDGALYVPARLDTSDGTSPLAVVVTTNAGTEEVVTGFRHEYAHDAWLADRLTGFDGTPAGPLDSAVTGPWCRTSREELVLAFLMHSGDLGFELDPGTGSSARLQARMFSTYSRSGCFTACRTAFYLAPGDGEELRPGLVMRELERLLLCAPGWAGDYVGWPFGELALSYARRLAVAPVPPEQARAAARELIRDDVLAARNAHARPLSHRARWRVMPQQRPGSGLDACDPGRRHGGPEGSRLWLPEQREPGDPPGPLPPAPPR
jgi:hypothetical protein